MKRSPQVECYGTLIYMNTETEPSAIPSPAAPDAAGELSALQAVIAALQACPSEARRRIFEAAATFLKIDRIRLAPSSADTQSSAAAPSSPSHPAFSNDTSMSPKEFLLEKHPRTDVERIACLAFYLTHYRDTPHFKTLDLSKLNTEAAQPKFANAANSTNNAAATGYLVASTKGQKQLSAAGERFVRALPDRDAAKSAMAAIRPRRRAKRANSTKSDQRGSRS